MHFSKSIQVKALTKKSPVPFGNNLGSFIAEYFVVCRNVFDELEIFIAEIDKIKGRIHEGNKDGRKSYWLQPKDYEEFKDKWDIIGDGYI